jgi:hypothetical protein
MNSKRNSYKALIWEAESEATGKRVTVMADSLEQARQKLEEKYGRDAIFDLHDETSPSKSDDMP